MAGLREGAQRLVREAWGLAAGPREGPSGWSTPPPPLGDERWGRAAGELLHLRQLDSQLAKCFYHLLIHHDSGGVSHRNLLVSHTGSQLHQTEHENRRKIEGGGGWGGGSRTSRGFWLRSPVGDSYFSRYRRMVAPTTPVIQRHTDQDKWPMGR